LFISADTAKENEKKVLLPADVSKSAVHTVFNFMQNLNTE
jgi:hypothetical protein